MTLQRKARTELWSSGLHKVSYSKDRLWRISHSLDYPHFPILVCYRLHPTHPWKLLSRHRKYSAAKKAVFTHERLTQ